MDEAAYESKFQELQKYVPFLENMIAKLQSTDSHEKPRSAQVAKMQSLHSILTTKNKSRMKIDTLHKCEDVLRNLYDKVDLKSGSSKPTVKTVEPILTKNKPKHSDTNIKSRTNNTSENTISSTADKTPLNTILNSLKMSRMSSAPASPSPPPSGTTKSNAPILIPTERIIDDYRPLKYKDRCPSPPQSVDTIVSLLKGSLSRLETSSERDERQTTHDSRDSECRPGSRQSKSSDQRRSPDREYNTYSRRSKSPHYDTYRNYSQSPTRGRNLFRRRSKSPEHDVFVRRNQVPVEDRYNERGGYRPSRNVTPGDRYKPPSRLWSQWADVVDKGTEHYADLERPIISYDNIGRPSDIMTDYEKPTVFDRLGVKVVPPPFDSLRVTQATDERSVVVKTQFKSGNIKLPNIPKCDVPPLTQDDIAVLLSESEDENAAKQTLDALDKSPKMMISNEKEKIDKEVQLPSPKVIPTKKVPPSPKVVRKIEDVSVFGDMLSKIDNQLLDKKPKLNDSKDIKDRPNVNKLSTSKEKSLDILKKDIKDKEISKSNTKHVKSTANSKHEHVKDKSSSKDHTKHTSKSKHDDKVKSKGKDSKDLLKKEDKTNNAKEEGTKEGQNKELKKLSEIPKDPRHAPPSVNRVKEEKAFITCNDVKIDKIYENKTDLSKSVIKTQRYSRISDKYPRKKTTDVKLSDTNSDSKTSTDKNNSVLLSPAVNTNVDSLKPSVNLNIPDVKLSDPRLKHGARSIDSVLVTGSLENARITKHNFKDKPSDVDVRVNNDCLNLNDRSGFIPRTLNTNPAHSTIRPIISQPVPNSFNHNPIVSQSQTPSFGVRSTNFMEFNFNDQFHSIAPLLPPPNVNMYFGGDSCNQSNITLNYSQNVSNPYNDVQSNSEEYIRDFINTEISGHVQENRMLQDNSINDFSHQNSNTFQWNRSQRGGFSDRRGRGSMFPWRRKDRGGRGYKGFTDRGGRTNNADNQNQYSNCALSGTNTSPDVSYHAQEAHAKPQPVYKPPLAKNQFKERDPRKQFWRPDINKEYPTIENRRQSEEFCAQADYSNDNIIFNQTASSRKEFQKYKIPKLKREVPENTADAVTVSQSEAVLSEPITTSALETKLESETEEKSAENKILIAEDEPVSSTSEEPTPQIKIEVSESKHIDPPKAKTEDSVKDQLIFLIDKIFGQTDKSDTKNLLGKLKETIDPKKFEKIQRILDDNSDSESGIDSKQTKEINSPVVKHKRRIKVIDSDSSEDESGVKANEETCSVDTKVVEVKSETISPEENISVPDITITETIQIDVPKKIRKQKRSALEILQHDVRDMFISEGVLTATGYRMCRLLKEDTNKIESKITDKVSPPARKTRAKKVDCIVDENSPKSLRSRSITNNSTISKNSDDETDKDSLEDIEHVKQKAKGRFPRLVVQKLLMDQTVSKSPERSAVRTPSQIVRGRRGGVARRGHRFVSTKNRPGRTDVQPNLEQVCQDIVEDTENITSPTRPVPVLKKKKIKKKKKGRLFSLRTTRSKSIDDKSRQKLIADVENKNDEEPFDIVDEGDEKPSIRRQNYLRREVVVKRRKPGPKPTKKYNRWKMGIFKNKKKLKNKILKTEDDIERNATDTEKEEEDKCVLPINETSVETSLQAVTSIGNNDKDYFWNNSEKYKCKLCQYNGKAIGCHYALQHIDSDVLIARINPEEALQAINDSKNDSVISAPVNALNEYVCRFCHEVLILTSVDFFEHITKHTGELRYGCSTCLFKSVKKDTLKSHYKTHHKGQGSKPKYLYPMPTDLHPLYGYLCSSCNFTQLFASNIDKHIERAHTGQQIDTVKILLSKMLETKTTVKDEPHELPSAVDDITLDESIKLEKSPSAVDDSKLDETLNKNLNVFSISDDTLKSSTPNQNPIEEEEIEVEDINPTSFSIADALRKKIEEQVDTDVLENVPTQVPVLKTDQNYSLHSVNDCLDKLTSDYVQGEVKKEPCKTTLESFDDSAVHASTSTSECNKLRDRSMITDPHATELSQLNSVQTKTEGQSRTGFSNEDEEWEDIEEDSGDSTSVRDVNEVLKMVGATKTQGDKSPFKMVDTIHRLAASLAVTSSTKTITKKLIKTTEQSKDKCRDSFTMNESKDHLLSEIRHDAPITKIKMEIIDNPVGQILQENNMPDMEIKNEIVDESLRNDKINDHHTTISVSKIKSEDPVVENNSSDQLYNPTNAIPRMIPYSKDKSDESLKFCMKVGLVQAAVNAQNNILYSCLVKGCCYRSMQHTYFMTHLQAYHSKEKWDGVCKICQKLIVKPGGFMTDMYSLKAAFSHLITVHKSVLISHTVPQVQGLSSSIERSNSPIPDTPIGKQDDDNYGLKITEVYSLCSDVKKTSPNMELKYINVIKDPYFFNNLPPLPPLSPLRPVNLAKPAPANKLDNKTPVKNITPLNTLSKPHYPKISVVPITKMQENPTTVKNSEIDVSEHVQESNKHVNDIQYIMSKCKIMKSKGVDKFPLYKLTHLYKCMAFDCSFSTNTPACMEKHVESHESYAKKNNHDFNENKPYLECAYCFDVFNDFILLNNHIVTAHGHCMYQCRYCYYRCVSLNYMSWHQEMLHEGMKHKVLVLPISPHILEAYNQTSVMTVVCPIQQYECTAEYIAISTVCKYTTYRSLEFMKHLQSHVMNGIHSIRCHICKMQFNAPNDLVDHYKTHDMMTFQCMYCTFGADVRQDITVHLMLQHSNKPPKACSRVMILNKEAPKNSISVIDVDIAHSKDDIECVNIDPSYSGPEESYIYEYKQLQIPDDKIDYSSSEPEPFNPNISLIVASPEPGTSQTAIAYKTFVSNIFKTPEKCSNVLRNSIESDSDSDVLVIDEDVGNESVSENKSTDESQSQEKEMVNFTTNKSKEVNTKPTSKLNSILFRIISNLPIPNSNPEIPIMQLAQETNYATDTLEIQPNTVLQESTDGNEVVKNLSNTGLQETKDTNEVVKNLSNTVLQETKDANEVVNNLSNTVLEETIALSDVPNKSPEIVRQKTNDLTDAPKNPPNTDLEEHDKCDASKSVLQKTNDGSDALENLSDTVLQEINDATDAPKNISNTVLQETIGEGTDAPNNISKTVLQETSDVYDALTNSSKAVSQDTSNETDACSSLPETVLQQSKVVDGAHKNLPEHVTNISHRDSLSTISSSSSEDDFNIQNVDEFSSNEECDPLQLDNDSRSNESGSIIKSDKGGSDSVENSVVAVFNIIGNKVVNDPDVFPLNKSSKADSETINLSSEAIPNEIENTPSENNNVDKGETSLELSTSALASMDTTTNDDEKPVNNSGILSEEPVKVSGFIKEQLYVCNFCNKSVESCILYKAHLETCVIVNAGIHSFSCPHCKRAFKHSSSLVEHIKVHGSHRYSCSICQYSRPVPTYISRHFKQKHKISNPDPILISPVDPLKTCTESDLFIMTPKAGGKYSKKSGMVDTPKEIEQIKINLNMYGPNDIEKLPLRPVYAEDVCCLLCSFKTKVRTNMIRHLQFHSDEKAVPQTTPLNPVPCLETNELHFDKMTNLACSSNTERPVYKTEKKDVALAAINILGPEEVNKMPQFIEEHKRYVCGITSCAYLTMNETMLKHHYVALHSGETSYKCPHCPDELRDSFIGPICIEKIMAHLKLHNTQLFKCSYCMHCRSQKNAVEKHITEKHPDKACCVAIVRGSSTGNTPEKSEKIIESKDLKDNKPKAWQCSLCVMKFPDRTETMKHLKKVHSISSQYKCGVCSFRSSAKQSFNNHFVTQHPNLPVAVINMFYKLNADDLLKQTTESPSKSISGDTTPLWSRDMAGVRHIRGILFDEEEEVSQKRKKSAEPTKIKKKLSQDNLTDISAKSRKSSELLKVKKTKALYEPVELPVKLKKLPEIVKIDKNKITEDITESGPGYKEFDKLLFDLPQKRKRKVLNESYVEVEEFDDVSSAVPMKRGKRSKTDSFKIQEDTSIELLPPTLEREGSEDEKIDIKASSILDNRSKIVDLPVSVKSGLNMPPKDQMVVVASDLVPSAIVDLTSNDDVICIDDDSWDGPDENEKPATYIDILSLPIELVDDLVPLPNDNQHKTQIVVEGLFGPYGEPRGNHFLCPLCNGFSSISSIEMQCHLYNELKYIRWTCVYCNCSSWDKLRLLEQCETNHPARSNREDLKALPYDNDIEHWVSKVLKTQKDKMIMLPAKAAAQPNLINDESTRSGLISVIDVPAVSASKVADSSLQKCPYCDYKTKIHTDLKHHKMRHWLHKPFKCGYCHYEDIRECGVKKHCASRHPEYDIKVTKNDIIDPEIMPLQHVKKGPKPKGEEENAAIYVCHYCPKREKTIDDLKLHWECKHNESRLSADGKVKEQNEFKYKIAAVKRGQQKEKVENGKKYKCLICQKQGFLKNIKAHHYHAHSGKTLQVVELSEHIVFRCNVCDFVVSSITVMQKHLEYVHQDLTESYTVVNTTQGQGSDSVMEPAGRQEVSIYRYQCHYCNGMSENKSVMIAHHEQFHSHRLMMYTEIQESEDAAPPQGSLSKKYGCSECDHSSDSYASICDHLRSHLQPYSCYYCDKRSNFPSLVKQHCERIHPNLPPKHNHFPAVEIELTRARGMLRVLMEDGTVKYNKDVRNKRESVDGPVTCSSKTKLEEDTATVAPPSKKLKSCTTTVRSVARKSTTKLPSRQVAKKSTTPHRRFQEYGHENWPVEKNALEEYSYYGSKPNLNIDNITTVILVANTPMQVTIEKLNSITDLFPRVLVEDYKKYGNTST